MDVKAWKAWGSQAIEHGVSTVYGPPDEALMLSARQRGGLLELMHMHFPRAIYEYRGEDFFVDYPPLSVLLLWAAAKVYRAFDPAAASGRLHTVVLNLLPLAASIPLALVLRRTAPGREGVWRALAFWCNPAILLAAVLGYQDAVFALAALLGVLALQQQRFVTATAWIVTAGLLKPQASLLLPSFAALLLSQAGPRTWLKCALAGLAVATLVLAPWWWTGHLLSALDGCRRPLSENTLSAQNLNLWWIAGWRAQWAKEGAWPVARILFSEEFRRLSGIDPQWPSRLLLLAGTVANVFLLLRIPATLPSRVPLSMIVQTHVYALFGTSVHENHTYLAVVLGALMLFDWPPAPRVLAATSGFLFANLFLFEGVGRGLIRDRVLLRFRMLAGLDLTVVVAVLHVALVVWLFVLLARAARAGRVSERRDPLPGPSTPGSPGPLASPAGP